ncbi:MAG: hypothetical protein R2939_20880 [Kofleriaceae bacterium]
MPELLPRLRPCVLATPAAVARLLAVDGLRFDRVIFDEASRLAVADALPALACARQAIVLGDPRQLRRRRSATRRGLACRRWPGGRPGRPGASAPTTAASTRR